MAVHKPTEFMNVQTYKLIGHSFTVKAFRFDAEQWIYQRQLAYPMIDCQDISAMTGLSSLGSMFTYQPMLYNYPVSDGDYIIMHRNCYGLVKAESFYEMYELVNE